MSEDEKRAIQGVVLLEVEEAKSALALLRAKAEHWYKLQEKVCHFLARMKRDGMQQESAATETRMEIVSNLSSYEAATRVEFVLALDAEIEKAVVRLKKAEAAKKEIGFS
jgi:hypothetical protein